MSVAAAGWGLCYTAYRGYYAAGGTAFLPGVPASPERFQLINAAGTVILAAAAILPVAALPFWTRTRARVALLAVCWLVAVGCWVHALVAATQRILSLAGLLTIEYPAGFWTYLDRRTADLQDLFGNEPWFLLEGLAYAAIGWIALGAGPRRRRWVGSALAATAVLSAIGLLSATGVIGRLIIL